MSKFYSRLIGWGHCIPQQRVTNHDIAKQIDTSDEWIVARSGIHERRFMGPDETLISIATTASQAALDRASIAATDLDLIILASNTAEYLTPPVSSLIQHELGAEGVAAFTLVSGCTGFVYALSTAHQFIASGAYRNILVVGAERLSHFMDPDHRGTYVLFGDGAAAIVLQATTTPCGLHSFVLGSDGSGGEHLVLQLDKRAAVAGGEWQPGKDCHIHMNGREVFKFATRMLARAGREALQQAGMTMDDIDWIVPHQANLRIIQSAARQLGVPLERFIINLERYGNTSAASIPLAMSEALDSGQIRPNDKILMIGFGAGLTWGAGVFEIGAELPRVEVSIPAAHLQKVSF